MRSGPSRSACCAWGVTTAVGGNCGSNRQWPFLMEEHIAAQAMALAGARMIGEPETMAKIKAEFDAMPK